MKQCPKCRLLFAGGELRFCRYDGSPLINKIVTHPDEAVTILFPTGPINNQFAPLDGIHRRNKTGKLSR